MSVRNPGVVDQQLPTGCHLAAVTATSSDPETLTTPHGTTEITS